MLGKMKNFVGGLGGSIKNFDPSKFAHKGATGAFGSAGTYVNSATKNAAKVASNGAANDNFVVGIAKGIDSSLGGHGQMLYSQAKDLAENASLTKGLIPGADEMKQVRREFGTDKVKQAEVASALNNQQSAYRKELDTLKTYQQAIADAGGDMQHADVLAAMKGQYEIGGQKIDYDLSSYGADPDVIRNSMGERAKQLVSMDESIAGDLANVQQGFIMQDQNALEKAQTYFSNGQYGKKRMAAAGIGVAGVAVGGRLASGGSLTRDAEGRRDIVGVPFI